PATRKTWPTASCSIGSGCRRSDRSELVKPLVPCLLDRKARQHVEHRRRQSRGARERGRRPHQRVDLQAAAELIVLQDRWLWLGRGTRAGESLDARTAALADGVGLFEQARYDIAQRRLVPDGARGLAGQQA